MTRLTSLFQNKLDILPVVLGLIITIVLGILGAICQVLVGVNPLFWPMLLLGVVPALGFLIGGLGGNLLFELVVVHRFGHHGLGAKAPADLNWVGGTLVTIFLELPVLALWWVFRSFEKFCQWYREAWYFALTLGERAWLAIPTFVALVAVLLLLAVAVWTAWNRLTTLRLHIGEVLCYTWILYKCWHIMVDLGLPLWVRILWTALQVILTAAVVIRGA